MQEIFVCKKILNNSQRKGTRAAVTGRLAQPEYAKKISTIVEDLDLN